MVENQNVSINLIYNCVMAGFRPSRGQGVPLHRGLHQLGASTNPNRCIAYPRTLYLREFTLPGPNYTGVTGQNIPPAGVYPSILWPRPIYTPGIFWPGPIHTPSGHNIPRDIN